MTGFKVTSNIHLFSIYWISRLKLSFRPKRMCSSFLWCSPGTFPKEWTRLTSRLSRTRLEPKTFSSKWRTGQSSRTTQTTCGTTCQWTRKRYWPNWWVPPDWWGPCADWCIKLDFKTFTSIHTIYLSSDNILFKSQWKLSQSLIRWENCEKWMEIRQWIFLKVLFSWMYLLDE